MLNCGRKLLQILSEEQLLKQQQHTIVDAPDHEIPVRSVPDSGQKPDNHDVADLLPLSLPVSSERDVDIFTEPGSKRDVPPPPEFRHAP